MLRILGTQRKLCDGISRRDLLHIGGLGALGLGAANLLSAADVGERRGADPTGRAGSRTSFGKAKACILIFPYGSPSSHETFDPKPDAPAEIQGEMKAISSSVPGLAICDQLPRLAKVMHELTVVRSMTHPYPLHGLAYAVTGLPTYTTDLETRARDSRHWPYIGSIVDYLESGQIRSGLPSRTGSSPSTDRVSSADSVTAENEQGWSRPAGGTYSGIPRNLGLPWLVNAKTDLPSVNAGPFGAFLGLRYDPVWTDFDGPGLKVSPLMTVGQTKRFMDPFGGTTPEGRFRIAQGAEALPDVSVERLRLRRSLLAQFDQSRRLADRSLAMEGMDHQRQMAWSLLTSSKLHEALDIGREPREVREAYGMTLFGQSCLAARRLVEAGGRFISVFWDCFGQFANGAWDTHQWHYPRLRELLLPGFDLAYPALIRDLRERGLLDDTLVIWMSEHGRTPKLDTKKPGAGRDHWSRAYSVALAGGGAAQGKVVGQTTRDGGDVLDNPVSPKDILATAFHLLGIDPHTTVPDQHGRPYPIAGDGKLREELLG